MPDRSISFVIPMYNERQTIERTLRELTRIAGRISDDYEIIVSDDASSDGSNLVVGRLSKEDSRIKLKRLDKNTKFGGALKAGIEHAQKDIIIYTDSDLPVDFEDIKGALSVLDSCDIVTAYSRIHKGETFKRKMMSKIYNFLIQLLFKTNIRDINSGFKIFKKGVFDSMELASESPFIDVEIFVKAMKKNYVIKQYPIVFKHREHGKSYISRPAVIFKTIADILRFRLKHKK